MDVPLYPEATRRLEKAARRARDDVSSLSGVAGDGPIERFEALLEEELDASYALAQTNGTSALETALVAAGVGPGDEVILPAYTWPQTLSPVLRRGATPVFADLAPGAVTVGPESVQGRVSPDTSAIIGVYLHGFPPPAPQLEEIARQTGATLIFDAAQGFGALISGKRAGVYGDCVALSFGRGKLLSVGEGGALLCDDRALYERAVAISQHPLRAHRQVDDLERRQALDGVAANARLSPLLAELAIGQLEGMRRVGVREQLHRQFSRATEEIEALGLSPALPPIPEEVRPSGIELPLSTGKTIELNPGKLDDAIEGYAAYEGGLSAPLYETPTIQEGTFPLPAEDSPPISAHETHHAGSCPHCEARCEGRQIILTSTSIGQG
jgi:dTDP-4-amino-4,6-dideoxygalactose transaminase